MNTQLRTKMAARAALRRHGESCVSRLVQKFYHSLVYHAEVRYTTYVGVYVRVRVSDDQPISVFSLIVP